MPNVRHYYAFQIWPDSCAMGGKDGAGDRLREQQRTLPDLFSNLSVMSTLGIRPPGGCHFPMEGYTEFARLLQPLVERDLYGKKPARSVTPPNLRRVAFTNAERDALTLEFDQPVVWKDTLAGQFYLDGAKDQVVSGSCRRLDPHAETEGPVGRQIHHLPEGNGVESGHLARRGKRHRSPDVLRGARLERRQLTRPHLAEPPATRTRPNRRGCQMDRSTFRPLAAVCLILLFSAGPVTADDKPPQKAEMAGYLLVPHEKVDKKYNAGFSMYVAAWPLLKNYPGQEFQSGLFGTWMFAQYDGPKPEKVVLRHRGRPRLVAGHAVRHRDAEVHHGRGGPELQRVGERPRCRQGPRLEEARRATTPSPSSARGCCGRRTA